MINLYLNKIKNHRIYSHPTIFLSFPTTFLLTVLLIETQSIFHTLVNIRVTFLYIVFLRLKLDSYKFKVLRNDCVFLLQSN